MKLRKFILPALLSPLLLCLTCPAAQAFSGIYYVIPTSAPLRECASPKCEVLLTVYQGNQVQILDRTDTGWSKVRLVEREGIGWIPSNLLSYSPDLKAKHLPTYYANTNSLAIHQHPTPNSSVLFTLNFNDPVEMLGVSTSGWAQVRDLRSNTIGWVAPRYLSDTPLSSPKSPRRRRAPARKAAPQEKAPTATPPPPSAM